ncbi:hypothetical protein B9T16_30120, partial [Arthrospira sp. PCC 8006]
MEPVFQIIRSIKVCQPVQIIPIDKVLQNLLPLRLQFPCPPFFFVASFHFLCVGIYKEEARDRLIDPLATWKI